MNCISEYTSPLGTLTLYGNGEALTGLWFEHRRYGPPDGAVPVSGAELPLFREAARWLDIYFAGKDPGTPPPLAPQGSSFRQAVWQQLREIPYGCLTTYGAIARELEQTSGRRVSAQAVGGAVGHNPISILIPCHRVVGTDGSLTGFGGGLDAKINLLTLEQVDLSKLYRPVKGTAL